MNKEDKLREAIKAMQEAVPTVPRHLTIGDLEEINLMIDSLPNLDGSKQTSANAFYQFDNILKRIVEKPPQEAKYMTVSKVEYNDREMSIWRETGVSYFVEVRVDTEGTRLAKIQWDDRDLTEAEALALVGIR